MTGGLHILVDPLGSPPMARGVAYAAKGSQWIGAGARAPGSSRRGHLGGSGGDPARQLAQIEGRTGPRPLSAHTVQPTQQETPEALDLLENAEHRFHRSSPHSIVRLTLRIAHSFGLTGMPFLVRIPVDRSAFGIGVHTVWNGHAAQAAQRYTRRVVVRSLRRRFLVPTCGRRWPVGQVYASAWASQVNADVSNVPFAVS